LGDISLYSVLIVAAEGSKLSLIDSKTSENISVGILLVDNYMLKF